MLQPWSDTSTWNSLANGVTADGTEASSIADASISANSVGDVDLTVTGTVQSWVNATTANHGWVVLPNGSDGWHLASAEHGTADYRPELIVTFVASGGDLPPVANAGADQRVLDNDGDGWHWSRSMAQHPPLAASIVSYIWTLDGVQVANRAIAPDVAFPAPGVYHVILTVADGSSRSSTDEVVITVEVPSLFSENFESGGFAAGGWSTAGQAIVETTSAHNGTYGALLKRTSNIQTMINIGSATGVSFTYWARTNGLRAGSEYLYVEWSPDGSTWQELNSLTGATGWAQYSHEISPAPSSFMIRFRTNGSAGSDMAMIDDIVVSAVSRRQPGAGRLGRHRHDGRRYGRDDSRTGK